jgi:lysozyme
MSGSPSRRALIAKVGGTATLALLIGLVTTWEGYRARVYYDPIGRLAVCYGHDDQSLTPGDVYTQAECEAILDADLLLHAEVLDCVNEPARSALPDGVKAALVSIAFNAGVGALCGSTFVRRLNAGEGRAACAELSRWAFADGRDCRIKANNCIGLIKRRADERRICEG